jgi:hypothetical protein
MHQPGSWKVFDYAVASCCCHFSHYTPPTERGLEKWIAQGRWQEGDLGRQWQQKLENWGWGIFLTWNLRSQNWALIFLKLIQNSYSFIYLPPQLLFNYFSHPFHFEIIHKNYGSPGLFCYFKIAVSPHSKSSLAFFTPPFQWAQAWCIFLYQLVLLTNTNYQVIPKHCELHSTHCYTLLS